MDELDNILDPCEQIADALVEYVNGLTDLPITGDASNPVDPVAEWEAEHTHMGIFFSAYGESAEKAGRGGQALEAFQVTMAVMVKLNDTITRKRMNNFVRLLRRKIRGKRMAGFHWMTDETVTKHDPSMLREMHQFGSITRIGYVAMTGALD